MTLTALDTDDVPLSPQILTPDTDNQHVEHPPTVMNGKEDKALAREGYSHAPQISLLTALLQHTAEHRPSTASQSRLVSPPGIASAQSSVPSTAFSSPRNSHHGILQPGHASEHHTAPILRRGSSSTEFEAKEGIIGLGFGGLDASPGLQPVEEKRERIEWADTIEDRPSPSRGSRVPGIKFAVAQPESRSHSPVRQSIREGESSRFLASSLANDSEDTDDGYQEDEEDGFDSDSDGDDDDLRYPFARPTNFEKKRFIGATVIPFTSPTPAPALLPPPSRRGRGHIRVDDSIATSGDQGKSCSRHRSPPPTPSRHSNVSSSEDHDKQRSKSAGRLSDAGPRDGRAGSPMPQRLSSDTEDEDEEDEEMVGSLDSPSAFENLRGWRSDDAVFYGPRARQVAPLTPLRHRRRSAGQHPSSAVFVDSDEEQVAGYAAGVGFRGFLRRASEHIVGFARSTTPIERSDSRASPTRTHRPSFSVSLPFQAPCPPALDDTPAMAQGLSVIHHVDSPDPLTDRLVSTLNVQSD